VEIYIQQGPRLPQADPLWSGAVAMSEEGEGQQPWPN